MNDMSGVVKKRMGALSVSMMCLLGGVLSGCSDDVQQVSAHDLEVHARKSLHMSAGDKISCPAPLMKERGSSIQCSIAKQGESAAQSLFITYDGKKNDQDQYAMAVGGLPSLSSTTKPSKKSSAPSRSTPSSSSSSKK